VGAETAVRDVILRDGTTLRLRPPQRADADAVATFFAGLSDESLYLRFHGGFRPDEAWIGALLEPDWAERGVLVAARDADGDERVVAVASYTRLRDPEVAEVAFAVADELQRRGVGTRMLEQLAALAADAGVRRFLAEVAVENVGMLRVFGDAGFAESFRRSGDEVTVEVELDPSAEYVAAVDLRDHVAVAASLRPFFSPESVAVVGASPRRGSIGGELFRNVVGSGFPRLAYPVNRGGEPVEGRPGFASLEDVPGHVDLVFVCVPGGAVLGVAEAALRRGTRALCVISAGFAEHGEEGARRQEELLALVRAHGARLVGPNCLGIALADPPLNGTFAAGSFPPGTVGFCSQSGALGLALLERAAERGLGFSSFVSIGNKADVSTNDLLEHWQDDDATAVVCFYVESFGNPRKFGRVARRVARRKPLLALKGGASRAGARAAASHTAALAGSDAAVDALFRQAGVSRAATLEELLDAAVLLSTQPLLRGRRVALLTNAGGLAILCADAAEAAGLEVGPLSPETEAELRSFLPPEAAFGNPVDVLGSAGTEAYARALPLLLADQLVDAVVVLAVPTVALPPDDLVGLLASVETDKPVVSVGVAAPGVPDFGYPESAARALGRAAERAAWLRRPLGSVPELDGVDEDRGAAVVEQALARGGGWLEPAEARALLGAYGIPFIGERDAAGPEAAAAAARELGFPAVVKTAEPGAHKTETGGVALDLGDEEAVRAAAERIGGAVIVQPMAAGDVELLAGLLQDPVFGPVVAFGPGGVLAELAGGTSFALAPLTDVDAEELVLGGTAGRLVRGFRGAEPADAGALAGVLLRLARLGEERPEVAELDLNPVLAGPDGCVAVDARVRVEPAAAPRGPKTW
jgi:acyl-CoA synthetase (NDP forming)/RimJ/RimL family protein N-acetyltransferase